MKKLYACLSSFFIIVLAVGCGGPKTTKQKSPQGNILDREQSEVIYLLSKQVDSASNGFLEFKNFQKQVSKYSSDDTKPYNYTLNFIASIVAKKDCYWNLPSNFLYNGVAIKQISLDVEKTKNPSKSNVSFVKEGLGLPIEGTVYFNKEKNKLLVFDFTIRIHESVLLK